MRENGVSVRKQLLDAQRLWGRFDIKLGSSDAPSSHNVYLDFRKDTSNPAFESGVRLLESLCRGQKGTCDIRITPLSD
jgi:hypothetical protein